MKSQIVFPGTSNETIWRLVCGEKDLYDVIIGNGRLNNLLYWWTVHRFILCQNYMMSRWFCTPFPTRLRKSFRLCLRSPKSGYFSTADDLSCYCLNAKYIELKLDCGNVTNDCISCAKVQLSGQHDLTKLLTKCTNPSNGTKVTEPWNISCHLEKIFLKNPTWCVCEAPQVQQCLYKTQNLISYILIPSHSRCIVIVMCENPICELIV